MMMTRQHCTSADQRPTGRLVVALRYVADGDRAYARKQQDNKMYRGGIIDDEGTTPAAAAAEEGDL